MLAVVHLPCTDPVYATTPAAVVPFHRIRVLHLVELVERNELGGSRTTHLWSLSLVELCPEFGGRKGGVRFLEQRNVHRWLCMVLA